MSGPEPIVGSHWDHHWDDVRGATATWHECRPVLDAAVLAEAMNNFELRADRSAFVDTNPGTHRPDCVHIGWIVHKYDELLRARTPGLERVT